MEMKRFWCGIVLVFAALAASFGSGSAATLDDVMAQLQSMQRDNQAIRRDNEAMRKELAALRRMSAQDSRQSVAPANAPSRSLLPSATGAMAADMPAKQAYYGATPYAPYNWSGFYAGANAGYGVGDETISIGDPAIATLSIGAHTSGFVGGGQIGYNLQLDRIVLGIEADIQYAAIGGRQHHLDPGFLFAANKLDAFGTARGRIGFAFDRFLPYVTGGFAAGRNTLTLFQIGVSSISEAAVHSGWTAGAGLEYGVRDGWSVKAEYLHVDLGSKEYFSGFFGGATTNAELKFDLVRAGVNYRF